MQGSLCVPLTHWVYFAHAQIGAPLRHWLRFVQPDRGLLHTHTSKTLGVFCVPLYRAYRALVSKTLSAFCMQLRRGHHIYL